MGKEVNNAAYYMLITILYLEIQKGEKATKILVFQQEIGGTASCMKITIKATKGFGKLSSNETFFDDYCAILFNSAEDENEEGLYYCGSVETITRIFSWLHWKY